jgi:hypothetical protein
MELDVAALAISGLSLVVSIVVGVYSYRAGQKANAIGLEQANIARQAYEAERIPKLSFDYGVAVDLLTEPATQVYQLGVNNAGHVSVTIESVGFIFWNGEFWESASYDRATGSPQYAFPKLPHELAPRTRLVINMEIHTPESKARGAAGWLDLEGETVTTVGLTAD